MLLVDGAVLVDAPPRGVYRNDVPSEPVDSAISTIRNTKASLLVVVLFIMLVAMFMIWIMATERYRRLHHVDG